MSRFERKQVDVQRLLDALGIEYRDKHGELWACCPHPDHYERTPSWSIGAGGGHHCFGCKWQGGPADLVIKVVGLSGYPAAFRWIEEKGLYHDGALPLDVELEVGHAMATRLEFPPDVRLLPFAQWVTPARRYAASRGITQSQADRWRLGFATGGYYAGRLVLPTWGRSGELLNITGRAWSPSKTPKYLNAKDKHGWDPAAVFGEMHWPELVTRSTLVLCEGELNALAVERRGFECVGALGGSTLEKEQVLKLSQFQRVILATDIDRAGSDIARALKATLARWRRCAVARFPDRRDPNDLERQDPDLLDRLLHEAA